MSGVVVIGSGYVVIGYVGVDDGGVYVVGGDVAVIICYDDGMVVMLMWLLLTNGIVLALFSLV